MGNPEGAFTGECTAGMVAECGYGWALVGHSERRTLYGETDDDCVAKIIKAQSAGLRVIYAIGELKKEREDGVTDKVNQRMLEKVLPIVKDWDKFVIAYEPVRAIGTGKVATPSPDNCGALIEKPDIDGFLVGGASLKPTFT